MKGLRSISSGFFFYALENFQPPIMQGPATPLHSMNKAMLPLPTEQVAMGTAVQRKTVYELHHLSQIPLIL